MDRLEGLVCVVKAESTCQMVQPVLRQLRQAGVPLTIFTQDDPAFPAGVAPVDDTLLEVSYRQRIEIVPTLLRFEDGRAVDRIEGWDRVEWQRIAGVDGLGDGMPAMRPGCGSRTPVLTAATSTIGSCSRRRAIKASTRTLD